MSDLDSTDIFILATFLIGIIFLVLLLSLLVLIIALSNVAKIIIDKRLEEIGAEELRRVESEVDKQLKESYSETKEGSK